MTIHVINTDELEKLRELSNAVVDGLFLIESNDTTLLGSLRKASQDINARLNDLHDTELQLQHLQPIIRKQS